MLQFEIYSLLPSNKTPQGNLQHCTKLYKEVHMVLRNKSLLKNIFLYVLVLLNRQKKSLHPHLGI